MVKTIKILSILAALSLPLPALAAPTDTLVEGAKQCTQYLPRAERDKGIPTYMLAAISSVESGRYHKALRIALPWPWTINAGGKGYYFDTKAEAIAKARQLRASGITSMDVGCMQINLHHHADAFGSLEEAFDPQANIAYAARFLRGLYDEQKNWRVAASYYHSRTPEFANAYIARVQDRWHSITKRIRAAQAQVAALDGVRDLPSDGFTPQPVVLSAEAAPMAPMPPQAEPIPVSVAQAAPETQSIKIIEVRSAPQPSYETAGLVMQPDYMPQPVAEPVVQLASVSPAAGMAAKGPRFIFGQ